MNRKFSKFIIVALAASAGLTACNPTSEQQQTYAGNLLNSSTMISAFSLKANNKVMANLDNVFFSIDQVKGEIFNADSLPWGTDVRKIVTNISTQGEATVQIIMPSLTDGSQVTVEVSDSVNFTGANGVWARVTAADGSRERVYSVKVNVHSCNPDSLQWNMTPTQLPSLNLLEQQTLAMGNQYYCIARTAQNAINLYTTSDPEHPVWQSANTDLPADADVNSLAATDDALFIRCASGAVMTSTDGMAWTEATTGWSHIYGTYGSQLLGVKDGKWISWPAGNGGELPAGMPVSDTSRLWTFTNDWALQPQAMFIGGKDADGNLSGDAWGFDGRSWMRLSGYLGARQLPQATGMALVPYFTFRVNTQNFLSTKQSMWLAMGGKLSDGTLNKTVYYSLDNGVNWLEGGESIQLPSAIAPRHGASMLLIEKTLTSRAVRPINEWDAPYLLIMGGYDANDRLLSQGWVGVINRLTFKPLQ